ncbi:MAG: ferrous iron transport protein A [Lachnospiraceae bacterium]|nr:ferrous iron transport protein A [Lachnospiraceae bacterium]
MPITFADVNTEYEVKRIKGTSKAKQHLEDLGFHVGSMITITSKSGEDLIVKVKDSRVAISREMANKIMV